MSKKILIVTVISFEFDFDALSFICESQPLFCDTICKFQK